MDEAWGLWLFAFGLILAFVLIQAVVIPVFQRRCPRCGKFFATITHSNQVANVTTTEFQYDERLGTHREVKIRNQGFMVGYRCRGCDSTWERLRSRAAKVPLTMTEEGEYAPWKGRRTPDEQRRDP
jgi:hypothetical protein